MKRIAIVVSLILVITASFILIPAQVNAEDIISQRSSGEGVDIEVGLVESEEKSADLLEFRIYMDTHSGDLTEVNFLERIQFNINGTEISSENFRWVWESKSSHHPSATFTVSLQNVDESQLYPLSELELIISDIRGYDHEFNWEFTPNYIAAVANEADGTVSLVDYIQGEVLKTIEIGEATGHGLAVSPDRKYLYTGDMENGILKIYDVDSQEIITEIDIEAGIHGLDITPDGKLLFISPSGDDTRNLLVYDTEKNEIIKSFDNELVGKSSHVTIDNDNSIAVSALLDENMIQVISIDSLEVIADIEVGEGPNEARISPDGNYVYVANWESNEISVIDLNTFELITNIPAGEGTHGVDVSPDGREVWTANRRSNDVSIIDSGNYELIETVASGEYANHLKFTPDGRKVLVTNARENELVVFDSKERIIINRIEVGNTPHEVEILQQ